ncbi:MAG: hypothetical protein AB7I50_13640 [Vicinamibacterales bacterium]
MNDLRVPTTILPVEIRCTDGRRFVGDIFMPAQSSRQPGPMRPDEWADTVQTFFPFRSYEARCRTIFNRDSVVSITVPAAVNEGDEDELLGNPVYRVGVDAGDEHFEGRAVVDMPPNQQRVVDWLNAPGLFITVRAGVTHHLIQKRHVTRVVEIPEDEA